MYWYDILRSLFSECCSYHEVITTGIAGGLISPIRALLLASLKEHFEFNIAEKLGWPLFIQIFIMYFLCRIGV